MIARTYSATLLGVNAVEVEIESSESPGLQFRMSIVGLPDTAVKESRDRVLSAMRTCGFYAPTSGTLTVNLAPADLRKEGPGFDLPIALCLVAGRERLEPARLLECCVVGELALNGELRPVRGLLATALEARAKGRRQFLVPKRAAVEASIVEGIEVIGINDLREAVEFLRGDKPIAPEPCRATEFFAAHASYGIDFSEVKGQQDAKRAIEVAVGGNHNLLILSSLPPRAESPILRAFQRN